MTFYDWVLAQLPEGKRTQAEAARRIGVAESTVGRWKTGTVSTDTVRKVADALPGAQILGAFVAAGYLSEDEAAVSIVDGPPRELTDEELADEVRARLLRPQASKPARELGKVRALRPEDQWQHEHDLAALRHPDAPDADLQGLDDGEE